MMNTIPNTRMKLIILFICLTVNRCDAQAEVNDFAIGASNATVLIYNGNTLALVSNATLQNDQLPSYSSINLPNGQNYFIATNAGNMNFFNKTSYKTSGFIQTIGSSIRAMAFASDTIILIAYTNQSFGVGVYDLSSNTTARYYTGHNSTVRELISLENQINLAASSGNEKTIRIWNWSSGATLQVINVNQNIGCLVQVSSNLLASGDSSDIVKIWSISQGILIFSMKGHKSDIKAFKLYNTDYLVSSDCSGETIIWSWVYGFPLARIQTHNSSACAQAIDITVESKLIVLAENKQITVGLINQTVSFLLTIQATTLAPRDTQCVLAMNSITSTLSSLTVTPTTTRTNSAYAYIGCYKDNDTIRDLNGTIFHLPNNNSAEVCYSYCKSSGFAYFGLQYGSACLCGNRFGLYGASSTCSMPCTGDSSQICGDVYVSSVYSILEFQYIGCYHDEPSRDLSGFCFTSGTMTVEMCLSTCARYNYKYFAVQAGYFCSCDNQYGRYGGSVSPCQSRCAGNTSQVCGGGYSNSVYKINYPFRPTTQLMIAYMGCFKDVAGDPALAHIETNVGDGTLLSPSICFLSCVKLGYLYSATQNGTGCFCGNSYNKHGYAGSGCSSNCALITQHICGGYLRNTVYSNTETILQNYLGCYVRGVVSEDFTVGTSNPNPIFCISNCSNLGYKYAALFNGTTCFCGNQMTIGPNSETSAVCATYCLGSRLTICGGRNSTTVFGIESRLTTTTTTTTITPATTITTRSTSSTSSCVSGSCAGGGGAQWGDYAPCNGNNSICEYYSSYGYPFSCSNPYSCPPLCRCSLFFCSGCGGVSFGEGAPCIGDSMCTSFCMYGIGSTCQISAIISTDVAAILSSLSSLASIDFSTLTTAQTLSILASGIDATNCLTNCSNQGACKVSNNSLVCQCVGNFTGPSCSQSLDPCYYQPCSNNGTCLINTTANGSYSYTCECFAPYYGSNCQLKVNLCSNVTCSGNGKCVDKGEYTECSCFYLYSGDECQIESSKKETVDKVVSAASVIAIIFICLFYLTIVLLDLMNFYLWYKSGGLAKPAKPKSIRVKFTYIPHRL